MQLLQFIKNLSLPTILLIIIGSIVLFKVLKTISKILSYITSILGGAITLSYLLVRIMGIEKILNFIK